MISSKAIIHNSSVEGTLHYDNFSVRCFNTRILNLVRRLKCNLFITFDGLRIWVLFRFHCLTWEEISVTLVYSFPEVFAPDCRHTFFSKPDLKLPFVGYPFCGVLRLSALLQKARKRSNSVNQTILTL